MGLICDCCFCIKSGGVLHIEYSTNGETNVLRVVDKNGASNKILLQLLCLVSLLLMTDAHPFVQFGCVHEITLHVTISADQAFYSLMGCLSLQDICYSRKLAIDRLTWWFRLLQAWLLFIVFKAS